MSKFGFGSASGGGFSFGSPGQAAPSFGASTPSAFGSPASNLTLGANNSNVSFGAPPANSTLNFGANTGFGSSQPTTGFGAAPGSLGGFGSTLGATTGFGTAPAATGFGVPTSTTGFGTLPGAATGFGTSSATSGFGTTAAAPGFGASTGFGAPAPSGFGAPATTSTGFGALSTATSGFGMPATSQATSTGFGALPSSGFGAMPAASTSFGVSSTGFGTTTNTSTFGTALPNLSFGASNTNFGAAPPATGSLFGAKPSTGLGGFGTSQLLSGTTPNVITTTTVPVSHGLGGFDTSSLNPTSGNVNRTEEPPVLETPLPNEILSTIETFKQFVKEQRLLSADISRGSTEAVQKNRTDMDMLRQMLATLNAEHSKNAYSSERLKNDMTVTLAHAEMAQRTQEVPPGLQYENNAPLTFFMELVQNYEKELSKFRENIELTDKHLHSLIKPNIVGEQDLTTGMKHIHETLITLAGRLQIVHHEVEQQKKMYLQLRRVVLDDRTDVFATRDVTTTYNSPVAARGTAGPTPFVPGGLLGTGLSISQMGNTTNKSAIPSISNNNIGSPWGANTLASNPVQLGSFNTSLTTTDNFQLQRPPVGNKRGKH